MQLGSPAPDERSRLRKALFYYGRVTAASATYLRAQHAITATDEFPACPSSWWP
jgi:hypothetical protein